MSRTQTALSPIDRDAADCFCLPPCSSPSTSPQTYTPMAAAQTARGGRRGRGASSSRTSTSPRSPSMARSCSSWSASPPIRRDERAAEIATPASRKSPSTGRGHAKLCEFRRTEFGPAVYIDQTLTSPRSPRPTKSLRRPGCAGPGQTDRRTGQNRGDPGLPRAPHRGRHHRKSYIAAVGWTIAFLLVTAGLWLALQLSAAARRSNGSSPGCVGVESTTGKIAKTEAIVSVTHMILRVVAFLLFVILLYRYLSQVLYSFPATRGLAAILLGVLHRTHFRHRRGHRRGDSGF